MVVDYPVVELRSLYSLTVFFCALCYQQTCIYQKAGNSDFAQAEIIIPTIKLGFKFIQIHERLGKLTEVNQNFEE